MIHELTQDQKDLMPRYAEKWIQIGLSTERCDRAAAEKAAIAAYEVASLIPPKSFVWFQSPLGLAIGNALMRASVWDSVWDSVCDSVWDSVRASVRDSVEDSVRASVGDSVWASVRDSVRASVGDSVWASVRDSVWDSVRASVRDSVRASVWDSVWASVEDSVRASVEACVRDSVWDSVRASVYGSQDAHWLGFFNFFQEAIGLRTCNRLQPLMDLAKNCGWWIPREGVCLMSEKPTVCKLENGVIQSDDSPAIEYADGFKIWAIEGLRVDEQIVLHPETQTIDQLRDEPNEEIRRIRIGRFGWSRYLTEAGATVKDFQKSPGGWLEALMRCDDMTVLCTYDPSTGRPYSLEVDPGCETCEQAQRYLLSPDEVFRGVCIGGKKVDLAKFETYPVLRT